MEEDIVFQDRVYAIVHQVFMGNIVNIAIVLLLARMEEFVSDLIYVIAPVPFFLRQLVIVLIFKKIFIPILILKLTNLATCNPPCQVFFWNCNVILIFYF